MPSEYVLLLGVLAFSALFGCELVRRGVTRAHLRALLTAALGLIWVRHE